MSKKTVGKDLPLSPSDTENSFQVKSLNDSLELILNLMMNSSFYELFNELNELKIQEKTLIGIILGLITFILWCLVKCKKKRIAAKQYNLSKLQLEQGQMENYDNGRNSNKNKQQRHNYNNNGAGSGSNNGEDGYLSDSALSFFNKLGSANKNGPRFRKRDKLFFYGKKMLRTVSTVRGSISAQSAEKSKNIYKIFEKKILNKNKEDTEHPLYRRTDVPQFLLDIEAANPKNNDQHLPSALINLIKSVKVFGYFDQKIILEMCKYMETKTVYANNYLFKIGEPDDSIYVVESGTIHVYVTDEKGRKHLIKECAEGNHIFSLLSIMDVLTGEIKPYKTVSAKAVEDTSILRLPVKAFVEVLQRYPEYLVRITQIIIVRVQRVTFTALHNYLGLTSEIIQSFQDMKKKQKKLSSKESSKSVSTSSSYQTKLSNSETMTDFNDDANSNEKSEQQDLQHQQHHHRHKNDSKGRKYSMPLPPVEFFVDDPDDTLNKMSQKNAQSLTTNEILEKNPITESIDISKPKKESKLNSFRQASTSIETIDTVSSDNECNSDGSEFGSGNNMAELQKKLPDVQKKIAELLKLNDSEVLNDKIKLQYVTEGTILCREGDSNCTLMFVIDGLISAIQKELNGDESTIFLCHFNQFCGNMSVLSGEPSLFTFKAKKDTELAVISKENFHKIITAQPTIVLSVAHSIVKRMSPFVRQIDFALEWNLVESGSALFRQNTKAENIYIVLNGRLRSILTAKDTNSKQLVGEYGRGDLVGIVEILMEANNSTTVVAIRDTEVAQITSGLLNYIKYRHPRVVTRLIQMLSSKLLGTIQNVPSNQYNDTNFSTTRQPIDAPTLVSNLCTVAIMPVSDDVPLHAFTMKLCHALSAIDNTLLLTKDLIVEKLGQSALERVNEYRLCAWLGQQEDHHRIVLYQCENRLTPWTRRCMRQADCLLIVGLASNKATVGQLEKEIDNFAIRAQKELILLHKMDGSRPTNTVKWLNMRNWCTSHHHIRCPNNLFRTINNERTIRAFQEELNKSPVDKNTDFSRLARFLTGTSIGVVLGGGGARGLSHVGMIKAMLESNIPIDMIGGTSIGSFMGALWAEENNYERFEKRARDWSISMTSYFRQALDLTYPVTSMFTGSAFNKSIEGVFGNRQIEDLWIPYFCVTTDISSSKMRIHMNGLIWRYVRASMSYCWLFPPMCDTFDGHLLGSLWRYIRASMSLSGFFPALCDPIDGHLLLDGGYTNNLPADVMHRMGVNAILAIDVGAKDDDNFTNYGDELSGWWLLWKKWNHWATPVKVPDLTEIQSRLAYVSCQRGLEMVKNSEYCNYLRPPIDKYRTLQFGSFDEIREVGYNYGKILFDTWIKHAGSIERFLYKKLNSDINQPFSKINNDSSPINEKKNGVRIKKVKSFNTNKSQFEDLSQFVVSAQNKTLSSKKKLNSILKRDNIKNNDALLNESDSNDRRKRVSIESEQRLFDQLTNSSQASGFKRSQSNNEDDPNSSFMDYDEDDEYDDNSENLNYLDLINNSQSFEETIRNFKNGINRQTSEMSEENENGNNLYNNNKSTKNAYKKQDSET